MQTLKLFIQSLLAAFGVVWLFFEAYYVLANTSLEGRMGFSAFLAISIVLGGIWFILDGFCFAGYLKQTIEITSNAIHSSITVKFGDLFTQDGYKAISVNEFFDSTVDEKHVSKNTLHGIMLEKYWAGNITDWDKQVNQDLSRIEPTKTIDSRPSPGKHNCYSLGTTALVSMKDQDFLCVALATTDTESLQASATSAELQHAVRGLLSKARTVCAGQPLNIPLMGNGLARTGVKPNIIVDLLLLAIFEESKKSKITENIRIILHKSTKKNINLATIQQDWR